MPESWKSGPLMFWEFDSQWPDARNWKKTDTWHFDNNFYSDNCCIPETEKSRLWHFENNSYSDNCYIHTRNWKKQTSDVFENLIHNAKCQKVKKADSDILRIWSTIAICQKVTKADSDILTILEWSPMLQGNFNYIHSVFLYFIDSTYVILY